MHTHLPAPAPEAPALAPPARARHDGWTPARQRSFLESIAEGATVDEACARVGLSPASAYAFRRRSTGAAFALGWRAANLLARDHLAATLGARAIHGQIDTYMRADGSEVTRHRFDNRLGLAMLARLDRLAEETAPGAEAQAVRLIACEFEGYCDMVEQEGGPARAGLFLARRAAPEDAAEPHAALARADAYLRAGAGLAEEVSIADLDPAQRHAWNADQWRRAEAAGLLRLAPDDDAHGSQLSQLTNDPAADEQSADPVWWCHDADDYRTRLAPPDDFHGEEDGEFGDPDYQRDLACDELRLMIDLTRARRENAEYAGQPARRSWLDAGHAELAALGHVRPPQPPARVPAGLQWEDGSAVRTGASAAADDAARADAVMCASADASARSDAGMDEGSPTATETEPREASATPPGAASADAGARGGAGTDGGTPVATRTDPHDVPSIAAATTSAARPGDGAGATADTPHGATDRAGGGAVGHPRQLSALGSRDDAGDAPGDDADDDAGERHWQAILAALPPELRAFMEAAG